MFSREKIGIIVAEFLGTFLLAATVLGATKYFNFTAPWYVGLAAGVSLATVVAMFGRLSGAHVNPAVTLGLWSLKKIDTARAIVYVASQMLGGAVALVFYEFTTNTDVLKAGATSVDARIYTAELIGAALFTMGIAAAITQKLEGFYASFTIGASLFLGILIASVAAPGYLNPAVALANNTWDWTVVTAPIVGAILGMNIYSLIIAPADSLPIKQANIKRTQRK